MKFVESGRIEQNPFANASTSRNGGGYSQLFIGGFVFDDSHAPIATYTIDDTSCGEFGKRYDVSVVMINRHIYGWEYCVDTVDRNNREHSTFTITNKYYKDMKKCLKEIGYDIWSAEELEDDA